MLSGANDEGRRKWTRDQKLLLGAFIVATVTLAVIWSQGGGKKSAQPSVPTATAGATGSATTTSTTAHPLPPAKAVYLWKLTPSGGETPQTGEIQLGGRRFPNSIFYEGVRSSSSTEGPCAAEGECRSVTYDLGGRYTKFTATFGITSKLEVEEPDGHWWVLLDHTVLRQGGFKGTQQPERLALPLEHGHLLELRASAQMATEEGNLIWGDARLEP